MTAVNFKNRLQQATGLQLLMLALLLGALILASAGLGYIQLGFGDVARILAAKATGIPGLADGLDPLLPVVVWEVRLPRILTAAIVGGGLAVAGAVYQGILLNPLADPYTLGVSAGAAFGAALALLLDIDLLGIYSLPLCAFIGAAGTLATVIYLSAAAGGFSSNNLILSGIVVAAILSAGISFLKYVADEQVAVIIFWLMGSFASRTWTDVTLTLACVSLVVGVGGVRLGFRDHRLRGAFSAPYDAGPDRARQPAPDPGVPAGGGDPAAVRRHHHPGPAAHRDPHRGPDRPDRRAIFLLRLP